MARLNIMAAKTVLLSLAAIDAVIFLNFLIPQS